MELARPRLEFAHIANHGTIIIIIIISSSSSSSSSILLAKYGTTIICIE